MARVFEGMYIGGGWAAAKNTFKDYNPADGSVWADVPDCGRAETAAAIEAAQEAFHDWSKLPGSKRAHYLHKAAEIWERRKMEIIDAIQAEGGGWFGKGMFETGYVTEVFHAAAASVWNPVGDVMPSDYGKVSMAVRRPMGVVSVISPWNFPSSSRRKKPRISAVCCSRKSSKKLVFRRASLTSSPARATTCRKSAMS
jgi:acyl-CoA reductase-like NAD-dependent aldehyde dehydrogenase